MSVGIWKNWSAFALLLAPECKGLASALAPGGGSVQDNSTQGRTISVMMVMHFTQANTEVLFLEDENCSVIIFALVLFL